jgi:hypothetical protein
MSAKPTRHARLRRQSKLRRGRSLYRKMIRYSELFDFTDDYRRIFGGFPETIQVTLGWSEWKGRYGTPT